MKEKLSKKEQLVEKLRFPKDVLLGDSILTVTGTHELLIENYKGILRYDRETVFIQGKNAPICIHGKNLTIDYYTNEDMKISGCIMEIQFGEGFVGVC